MRRPLRRPLTLAVAVTTALVLAASMSTAAQADPAGDPGVPGQAPSEVTVPAPTLPDAASDVAASRTAQAQEALTTVREVFDGEADGGPGEGRGPEADPGQTPGAASDDSDATLALRDLALLRSSLPAAQRRQADRYLARPGDSQGADYVNPGWTEAGKVCNTHVCVHYASDAYDRSTAAYANQVLATVGHVDAVYRGAGYRGPKPDNGKGGDNRTDIYLANVGPQGLYGYCTSDQAIPRKGPFDAWAYCVLDNDYARDEFPSNTPTENLRVTAAHEYFHAVQFGYDIAEDGWFMEATATWAEDELYDGVNDNVQYLRTSPMTQPGHSLDQFGGFFHYGAWIFFRYLTEKDPRAQGGMPTLVREMWRRADSSPGHKDLYSLKAVHSVLHSRGTSLRDRLAEFYGANTHPKRKHAYSEAKANRYPRTRPDSYARMTASHPNSAPKKITLDHLSASTVRFTPTQGMGSKAWRVRVKLHMPPKYRGSIARITTYYKSGSIGEGTIHVSKKGYGQRKVMFGRTKVKYVEVTLVNGSERFGCWRDTAFSCQGKPKDDDLTSAIQAFAFR